MGNLTSFAFVENFCVNWKYFGTFFSKFLTHFVCFYFRFQPTDVVDGEVKEEFGSLFLIGLQLSLKVNHFDHIWKEETFHKKNFFLEKSLGQKNLGKNFMNFSICICFFYNCQFWVGVCNIFKNSMCGLSFWRCLQTFSKQL